MKQNERPRPPAVDEIKIFDNDDQAAKHYFIVAGNSNVLWPGHHYQKLIPSTAGGRGRPF